MAYGHVPEQRHVKDAPPFLCLLAVVWSLSGHLCLVVVICHLSVVNLCPFVFILCLFMVILLVHVAVVVFVVILYIFKLILQHSAIIFLIPFCRFVSLCSQFWL